MTTTLPTYASDLLTTAIEGGITYWALGRKAQSNDEGYQQIDIRPDPREGMAFEAGDARNGWQTLTLPMIEAAVRRITLPYWDQSQTIEQAKVKARKTVKV